MRDKKVAEQIERLTWTIEDLKKRIAKQTADLQRQHCTCGKCILDYNFCRKHNQ